MIFEFGVAKRYISTLVKRVRRSLDFILFMKNSTKYLLFPQIISRHTVLISNEVTLDVD